MKNNIKLAITVAVVVLGLGIWRINTTDTPTDVQMVDVVEAGTVEVSEDGNIVSYQGVVGETALATLESLIEVRTQDSDFGEFVTGIGEVDSDSAVNFWAFYVNGAQATEGAGTYLAQEGDQIEWRIEEINF